MLRIGVLFATHSAKINQVLSSLLEMGPTWISQTLRGDTSDRNELQKFPIIQRHDCQCKTCLIVQQMKRYPHPQMSIRLLLPTPEPGQLQTTQATAWSVTQDLSHS